MQESTQELCTNDNMPDLEIIIPVPSVEMKSRQDISTRRVLIETIVRKARLAKNDYNITSIPADFLMLLDHNIINGETSAKENVKKWVAFGRWLGFKEPITKMSVRHHLKLKWRKLRHASDMRAKNAIPGCAVN